MYFAQPARRSSNVDYNDIPTLQALVPSVFETVLSPKVSEKYQPIPTIRILEALWAEGWQITKAQQSKSRQDTHAKHLLRLRHKNTTPVLQGVHPEIVLINSHDGTSSYRLQGGVYRLVCLNGMVVGNDLFSARVRHMGNSIPSQVAESANKLLEQLPLIGEKVIELSQTGITEMGRKVFAISAIDARMDEELPEDEKIKQVELAETKGFYRGFSLRTVAEPVRVEDKAPTLWNVLNIMQEKMLKGGIRGGDNRRRIVAIKSVDRDVELNTTLWNIADNIREMQKTGQIQ